MTFPDHTKNNHGLLNVSGIIIFAFFNVWLSIRGGDRHWNKRDAQKLFNNYCMNFNIVYNAFTGVYLSNFVDLEDFFNIHVVAYELKEGVAKLVQCSKKLYSETMRLNMWKNQLSLVIDFEHCCNVYQCETKTITLLPHQNL